MVRKIIISGQTIILRTMSGQQQTGSNGIWQQQMQDGPPRAYHAAVVHDNKIWVLGGGNYVPNYQAKNDVWSSKDGIHWEQVTENAPWHERLWFSAVSYRGYLWVLGGWSNNPSRNWGGCLVLQRWKELEGIEDRKNLEGTP